MLSNKIREIMNRDVITATASETIFAVMETMVAKNVGRVIITENQAPVGIFTEQDVLKRVMNRNLDAKTTSVKQVMTSPIRGVPEDSPIVEVLGKMIKGKFRHLLVRGERRTMVGLVSMRRILKLAVELGHDDTDTQTIGSIMSEQLHAVDASRSVMEAIRKMAREQTGCVVVMSNGEPDGIFTERDVLKRVAVRGVDTRKTPVSGVMTRELVVMPYSALVGEVLAEMHDRGFRHMPIRGDKGDLVGIVSMGDVLKYATALDVDESVRRAWKEIEEFWQSEDQFTPG